MVKVHPFVYAVIAACGVAGIVILAVFAGPVFGVGAGVVTTIVMSALTAAKAEDPKP